MRTRWGSCNPRSGRIWLNEELAPKPPEAIDYVILHDLAHLISSRHDERFVASSSFTCRDGGGSDRS